jgi:hypothetical protein
MMVMGLVMAVTLYMAGRVGILYGKPANPKADAG